MNKGLKSKKSIRKIAERENDGVTPETLGDNKKRNSPSPIISFSETAVAKKQRMEDLEIEKEGKREIYTLSLLLIYLSQT